MPARQDQVRFLCGPDAACLKAHLSELSPSCAMFLLKSTERARPSPEPSPEPMAQVSGFYSQARMGEDGQMYIQEGRLSPREGKALQGEMQGMLDLVMSEFFGQPAPQPRVASPSPSTSSHPCDAEVTKCTGELNGVTSRDAIQQCLVAHYAQLSSGCKCFLHQTMGEELEKSAAAAKSSADPRVPAVFATLPPTMSMASWSALSSPARIVERWSHSFAFISHWAVRSFRYLNNGFTFTLPQPVQKWISYHMHEKYGAICLETR